MKKIPKKFLYLLRMSMTGLAAVLLIMIVPQLHAREIESDCDKVLRWEHRPMQDQHGSYVAHILRVYCEDGTYLGIRSIEIEEEVEGMG